MVFTVESVCKLELESACATSDYLLPFLQISELVVIYYVCAWGNALAAPCTHYNNQKQRVQS